MEDQQSLLILCVVNVNFKCLSKGWSKDAHCNYKAISLSSRLKTPETDLSKLCLSLRSLDSRDVALKPNSNRCTSSHNRRRYRKCSMASTKIRFEGQRYRETKYRIANFKPKLLISFHPLYLSSSNFFSLLALGAFKFYVTMKLGTVVLVNWIFGAHRVLPAQFQSDNSNGNFSGKQWIFNARWKHVNGKTGSTSPRRQVLVVVVSATVLVGWRREMLSWMRTNASVRFSTRVVDGARFRSDVVDEDGTGR